MAKVKHFFIILLIFSICFFSCSNKNEDFNNNAESQFLQQIVKNSKDVNVYLDRADMYIDNIQYDLALDDIELALSLSTNNKDKSMCLSKKSNVDLYKNKTQLDNKIKEVLLSNIKEAIKLDENNFHAYIVNGYIYIFDGNINEAINNIDKAIELSKNNESNNIKSFFSKACIYDIYSSKINDSSFMEEALKYYLYIVNKFDNEKFKKQLKTAYFNIGNIYIKKEDYKLAIDNFTKVIDSADDTNTPLTMKSYFFRGMAYYNNEEYNHALNDFKNCKILLEENIILSKFLSSVSPSLNYFMALSYYNLKDYDQAISNFNEYLKYKEEQSFMLSRSITLPCVYAYRGASYSRINKTFNAIIDLFNALKLKFDDKNFILKELQIAERNPLIVSTGEVFASHILLLCPNNTLVSLGDNSKGQCNVQDWKDIVAISANDYITVGLKKDGTCIATGWNGLRNTGQKHIENWKNVIAISAGGTHTVGLKKNGTCVAIGDNDYGQCNVQDWKDIVAISAGTGHTVGVKKDGTCVACGNNWKRQCDIQDWKDIVAVSASSEHTIGLKSDGTCVAVGNNYYGQCNVQDWKDIIAISAGGTHSVGLTIDNYIRASGDNRYYQCSAFEKKSDKNLIVSITSGGRYHSILLNYDGSFSIIGKFNYLQSNGNVSSCDWNDFKTKYKTK